MSLYNFIFSSETGVARIPVDTIIELFKQVPKKLKNIAWL